MSLSFLEVVAIDGFDFNDLIDRDANVVFDNQFGESNGIDENDFLIDVPTKSHAD